MPKETKQEETKKTETADAGAASAKDIEENKALTFLSYLGILALVPLLAKKDSKFAQYHAKQGLVLFVGWFVIAWIAGFIPFLGWFLIVPAVSILGIVLAIMGLINVANGEMKKLPVIGEFAKKINL
ncbi:MAG: DUF4870 domain-containing protein [Candidatus Moraniibacteriota bacterium]